ncbi:MAG: ATP-dependent helicase HrpB, partial [Myxococcota bacterium]|nr:ATP-dependent helicase HrpB [Myxococcota bacterium]
YTRADHDARPAFEEPEIRRADLAEAVLLLRRAGLRLQDLPLLDPPPAAAIEAAEELLRVLGALDGRGELTPRGTQMAALPVHPRQARLFLEGQARGVGAEAAAVAALIGERDLRLAQRFGADWESPPASGPSDLLALLEAYQEAQRLGFDADRLRTAGLDPWAARTAHRLVAELVPGARLDGPDPPPARQEALLRAVLAAYPDRVARRRAPRSDELLLCSGGSAWLAPRSEVREAEFLVAVDVEERTGTSSRTIVRLASAIQPDWLLDVEGAPLCESEAPCWNAAAGRVEVVQRLLYGQLVLDESRAPARGTDPAHWGVLLSAVRALGLRALMAEEDLTRLQARLALVAAHCPEAGLSPLPDDAFERALMRLCPGCTSLAELQQAPWPQVLLEACGLDPSATLRQLAELAPEHIMLPSGRRVRIHYALDRPPWIASRLQDFFGTERGPSIARGRVPLVLHLLAPNQRPVQVTSDLAGFWERHYPSVRRELCRRYPRHPWPEDPCVAPPLRRRPC